MSRVGKKIIHLPPKVEVSIHGTLATVSGPKGKVVRNIPSGTEVSVFENKVTVISSGTSKNERATHGLVRALIANMVEGVSKGFKIQLDISGVGYKAELKGKNIINFSLGFSHPILYSVPENVSITIPTPTQIVLESANNEVLGQTAAIIRGFKPPEPYLGKGIKYATEVIQRKAGKTGA